MEQFFTFVFGWAGAWLTIMVILMLGRLNLSWPDYEVIGFRASIAFICVSVFTYRWLSWPREMLIPAYTIFAYTAMTSTIRVWATVAAEENKAWLPTLLFSLSRVWDKLRLNKPWITSRGSRKERRM